jgi:hypothetical protein
MTIVGRDFSGIVDASGPSGLMPRSAVFGFIRSPPPLDGTFELSEA